MVYVYLKQGYMKSSEDIRQIHVKLNATLHRRLKVRAALRGTTMQEYVVEALEASLSRDEQSVGEGIGEDN